MGLQTVTGEYAEVKTQSELGDNVNGQRAANVFVLPGQGIDT